MSLLNRFRKNKSKQDLKEEIFEHICDLLNTKKNFGAIQHDLGLDTYIYKSSSNEVDMRIIKDLKECLTKHEKRILIEEIVPIKTVNPFLFSFVIKCKIETTSHEFQVSFHHQEHSFQGEGKT